MERREMRNNKPWYFAAQSIRGFEEPVQPPAGEPGQQPGEVTPPAADPKAGEINPETGKVYTEEEVAGLKSALQKERATAKENAKRLAAFEKAQQEKEDAEKSEIQRLTDQSTRASEKLQKLAAGYRSSKVEAAIIKAAGDAKFTDPTDALRPEVLAAIGVEQDEDDPTRVTVDEDSVKAAIKELAKAKPHYLAQQQKTTAPSGSKFGGNNNTQAPSQEQQLRQLYPALGGRG